jgi:hypothetical protein
MPAVSLTLVHGEDDDVGVGENLAGPGGGHLGMLAGTILTAWVSVIGCFPQIPPKLDHRAQAASDGIR